MAQAKREQLYAVHKPVQQEGTNYSEGARASADNVSTMAVREAANRLVAQWNAERSRRHFALSLTMPVLTGDAGKARRQELVGDD